MCYIIQNCIIFSSKFNQIIIYPAHQKTSPFHQLYNLQTCSDLFETVDLLGNYYDYLFLQYYSSIFFTSQWTIHSSLTLCMLFRSHLQLLNFHHFQYYLFTGFYLAYISVNTPHNSYAHFYFIPALFSIVNLSMLKYLGCSSRLCCLYLRFNLARACHFAKVTVLRLIIFWTVLYLEQEIEQNYGICWRLQ